MYNGIGPIDLFIEGQNSSWISMSMLVSEICRSPLDLEPPRGKKEKDHFFPLSPSY